MRRTSLSIIISKPKIDISYVQDESIGGWGGGGEVWFFFNFLVCNIAYLK